MHLGSRALMVHLRPLAGKQGPPGKRPIINRSTRPSPKRYTPTVLLLGRDQIKRWWRAKPTPKEAHGVRCAD